MFDSILARFGFLSVDHIMSSFNKVIARLEAHKQRMEDRVVDIDITVNNLFSIRNSALVESDAATKQIKNLKNLLA